MDEIHIDVLDYEENDDGSAIVTMELNEKARELLIQIGFNAILKDAIKNVEGFDEKDACCGANCSDVCHKS